MTVVTYRGEVEELKGLSFDVPDSVLAAKQAGSWIESQHRERLAREEADAEAERRQQELLAARLEKQRLAAEAEQRQAALNADEDTRLAVREEFRSEIDALTRGVLDGAAAVQSREILIVEKSQEWEQRHEEIVAGSEQLLADAKAQVEFSNATTQANTDALNEHMANQRQQFSELESELRATVQTLRGPKGDKGERGLAGSGVARADADPRLVDPVSAGQKWFGRALVPGDQVRWSQKDGARIFRTADGKTWQEVDFETNKQELVSQPISVLDQSTKSTVLVTNQLTGGGGGGGGLEHFVTNRTSGSNFIVLADSSNWSAAGFQDPRSGFIWLELLDPGTATSGTLSCVFDAGVQVGTTELTTFAMTGVLFDAADLIVELDAVRIPAPVIPPSLAAQGVTAAPGASAATQIKMRAYSPARGDLLIRGGVSWLMDAEAKPRLPTDPTPLADQPMWIWS
jgi:hypothetical protein